MPTRYDASSTEAKWYERWEAAGLFQPDPDSSKPVYTITIPPPNITGSLHMGHALCYPLQDLLGRYRRMRGDSVLILPGQDHAGIATQSVVDKQLRKEGSSAAHIGREKFVERVWEWRKESGDTILNQFRALGCAFDWSRSRFTLDPAYHDAVLKVFVDWFERGLIFRGKRVVNWDPKLKTSVSDIETERQVIRGKLYHVRYPFADGSGHVVIATTRPETMLADVAVAVHPSDKRYEGLVGKTLILPLVNREIPLVADMYPDPAFGTGAVKITPAHDANDYQVGVRHNLPMPVILDETAHISMEGPYFGMDRNEARKAIVADLEAGGFLEKIDDHEIAVVISDRSKEVIEPLLSEQWFCDQPKLAEPVIDAVKRGEVKFHPERYEAIFLAWMENIREWCISRQLWWGHRIPVWYTAEGEAFAGLNQEDAQRKAGDKPLVRQDDDVLDTWFSSGLWPFATLGWPENTADLKRFYPTSTLVTDRNIINLWVARMMMMGYDLTGEKPFSDVVIYATVLREDGRRMSKSLGTGIDPMEIINTLGADALRYTLLSQTGENQDLRYSERKTEEARNFANKIWNATRFVLMNVDQTPQEPSNLEPVDQWLLSRLSQTEAEVRAAYDGYDEQGACQALYRFFWGDVCDWYIEVSKPRLNDETQRQTPQWVLLQAFDAFLKMLHPVMPHLTEELYSHLPIGDKAPFLMSAPWPVLPDSFRQPEAEATIERVFEATRTLRALRAGLDLAAMKPVPVAYYEGDLGGAEQVLASQAWVEELRRGRPPEGERFVSAAAAGIDVHLPITGLVDVEKLLGTIDREVAKREAEVTKLEAQLLNPQFIERAKPEAIEKLRANLDEHQAALARLRERRALFA
ncbi:valine--tRNA ligase [Fimbriimonas ginsengisoli]|nr:valine--tRNA ligase [Fimbriimonas ginsengisoli]